MDIEEFYATDERRRASPEVELGTDWRDSFGVRYELSWVQDTGELYVMREPVGHEWIDPFGGIHFAGTHQPDETEVEGMTVAVVGTVADQVTLENMLAGWQDAMARSDSIAWLVDRLRADGVLGPADPSSPLTT